VTVVGVHLPAPQRSGAIPFWRRELRAVARDAERGGSAVVAGDFNADDGHVAFRSMVDDAELRSAQDHAGGGPGATWPAAWRPVPPLLRLDHVLVGEAVGIEDFGFLPRLGADHLGVRADLVLRPR
jgi:endonuclease/exonuclease/phosphatase family metal-dependent hydrolase